MIAQILESVGRSTNDIDQERSDDSKRAIQSGVEHQRENERLEESEHEMGDC